jgi:hypothetical protein
MHSIVRDQTVFQTTTPQIFSRDGLVRWTVDTDVSYFMPLFKQAGTFAFDLSKAISTLPSGAQPNGGYNSASRLFA